MNQLKPKGLIDPFKAKKPKRVKYPAVKKKKIPVKWKSK